MTITQYRSPLLIKCLLRGLAISALVSVLPAQALHFEPADELSIDLDTTLAYGAMWRVEEQMDLDPPHYINPGDISGTGKTNEASDEFQDFVLGWNSDDGNRNFEKGDQVSNRYAVTSDFDMNMRGYGLFLRAQVFYDSVYFEETSWDGEGWDDFYGTSPLAAAANGYLGIGDKDCDGDGDPDQAAGEPPSPGACDLASPRRFNGVGGYVGPESINNAYASGQISNPSHFSDDVKETNGFDARFLDAYVYGTFPIGDRNLDLRLGRQALGWGEALMLQGGIGFAVNRIDANAATSPGVELKEIFLPSGMLYGQLDLSESLTVEAYWQYEWKPSELFATGTYFSGQDMLESDILLTNTQFNANCMFGLGKTFNGADLEGNGGNDVCDGPNSADILGVGTEHWLVNNPNAMFKAEDVEPDKEADQFGLAFRMLFEAGSEAGLYFVQYHDKYPSLWAGNNGATSTSVFSQSNENGNGTNLGENPTWVGPAQDSSNVEGFNVNRYTIQYKERIKLYGLTYNTVVNDVQMGFELTYRENQPVVPACSVESLSNPVFDESLPNGPTATYDGYQKGLTLQSGCKDESAKYLAAYGYDFVGGTTWDPKEVSNKLLGWPAEAEVFTYNIGMTLVVPPSPLWDTGIFVGEFGGWYVGGFENDDLKVTDIGGFTKFGNGISALFLPQYKNVMQGVDLTVPVFVNYTIDGSFSYFSYNEKALWASIGLEAVYLSNMRVGLVYSAFGGSNSMWRDRDNIAFNIKYTF